MLRNLFTKTLWDQRRSLLAWAIGLAAVAVMYSAFYPSIRNPAMAEALKAYPQAIMDALGFQEMTSPEGYLGATVFGIIGQIVLILFTVGAGGRAIAGDEENGTLDFLLAHPISRTQVVLQRAAALAVATLVLAVAVFLAVLAVSGPAELSVSAGRIAAMAAHLALLGIFFGTLALCVGAATGRRAVALAAAAGVGVVTYFANTLAPQVKAIAWLQDLSPFYYYSGGRPLANGLQWGDAAILLAAALVLTAVAVVTFNRRDVAV
jgi:ABC-2 type transport system permease protein